MPRRFLPELLLAAAACSGGSGHPGDGGPDVRADAAHFTDARSTSGQSAAQTTAWQDVNTYRAAAGVAPINLSAALDQASQAHADYYVANPSLYATLSPHDEDPGTPTGYTGTNFWDRDSAAGYTGSPMSEVMAFFGDPGEATAEWMNSVLHRVPIIHPDAVDMGYGGDPGADVIDFGGPSTSGSAIVVWPPDGATGVPDTFLGNEGPMPPPPPSGNFPSGPIASVIFERGATVTITSHDLKDASGNSLAHTFIAPDDATLGPYLLNSCSLYGDAPASTGLKFEVVVSGTVNGAAFTKDWSFTTQ